MATPEPDRHLEILETDPDIAPIWSAFKTYWGQRTGHGTQLALNDPRLGAYATRLQPALAAKGVWLPPDWQYQLYTGPGLAGARARSRGRTLTQDTIRRISRRMPRATTNRPAVGPSHGGNLEDVIRQMFGPVGGGAMAPVQTPIAAGNSTPAAPNADASAVWPEGPR